MAENEFLDIGHQNRWRRTRLALGDPARSMGQIVDDASQDFDDVVRKLPIALRKGPSLLVLMRAAQDSPLASGEVFAAFTEKRLAAAVRAAIKIARSPDPAVIANIASGQIIEGLVNQLVQRARKVERFQDPKTRGALENALRAKFASRQTDLRTTLEASLRGTVIKPVKRMHKMPSRLSPKEVAGLSLTSRSQERPHAR